jgi:hypothetical protein
VDPEQARRLLADEPRYDWGFGEGRTCSLCGANVLSADRDGHTRWHRALAEVLGLGWTDLAARAPADAELAAAVDAVVHPRGLRRLSRIAAATEPWRAVPDVPLAGAGTATLLVGGPGVVVARRVGTAGDHVVTSRRTVHVNGHRGAHGEELGAAVAHVRARLGDGVAGGVLVVPGTLEGGDPEPPDVMASAADTLPDRLALLPDALAHGRVEALYDRARRSTTWT